MAEKAPLLLPHPTSSCAYVSTFTAVVSRPATDLLTLTFRVTGTLDRLRVPAGQPAAQTDGLWRRTCCEVFFRVPGERGYVEVNLSPSTAWAVYRFDDYRSGMRAIAPERPPEIRVHGQPDELTLEARVHLTGLTPSAGADLEAAVTAVLEDHAGTLSYWALEHPAEIPDFHDPRGFVLALPRDTTGAPGS